jgi:hypothetical protein
VWHDEVLGRCSGEGLLECLDHCQLKQLSCLWGIGLLDLKDDFVVQPSDRATLDAGLCQRSVNAGEG